jgi:hypothetical protein
MVLIARAAELIGMDTSIARVDVQQLLSKFGDTQTLGIWSQPSAAFCIKHNIVVGNQGIVEPDSNITRA